MDKFIDITGVGSILKDAIVAVRLGDADTECALVERVIIDFGKYGRQNSVVAEFNTRIERDDFYTNVMAAIRAGTG